MKHKSSPLNGWTLNIRPWLEFHYFHHYKNNMLHHDHLPAAIYMRPDLGRPERWCRVARWARIKDVKIEFNYYKRDMQLNWKTVQLSEDEKRKIINHVDPIH